MGWRISPIINAILFAFITVVLLFREGHYMIASVPNVYLPFASLTIKYNRVFYSSVYQVRQRWLPSFYKIFISQSTILKSVGWILVALHSLLTVHSFACIYLQVVQNKSWYKWTSINDYTSFVSNIFVVVTSGLFLGWWDSSEVQWSFTAVLFMGDVGDIIRSFRWLNWGTDRAHYSTNGIVYWRLRFTGNRLKAWCRNKHFWAQSELYSAVVSIHI